MPVPYPVRSFEEYRIAKEMMRQNENIFVVPTDDYPIVTVGPSSMYSFIELGITGSVHMHYPSGATARQTPSISRTYFEDWRCEYCNRLNPISTYECLGCGAGKQ